MRKLLALMFVMFFLVGTVSALDLIKVDNVKTYDEETGIVTITNTLDLDLFGEPDRILADMKLNTKQHEVITNLGYVKVGEFEIASYNDYGEFFKQNRKYDVNNDMKEVDIKFDYKMVVTENFTYSPPWTKEIKTGYRDVLVDIEDITKLEIKKGEKIKIEIWTTVNDGDYIEWVPEMFSKTIDEWASYSGSGGTETTDGDYTVHTFTSNGTFTVTGTITNVSILVVGGGGGTQSGTKYIGGGGGGGGVVNNLSVTLTAGDYPVVVGIGGAVANEVVGVNGQPSSFAGTTAQGGGGGGVYNNGNGANGASGGGGSGTNGVGGTGISGQGFAGGNGGTGALGGGGGGSSEVGNGSYSLGVESNNGIGGNGTAYDIYNGTLIYYAGGGAGGGSSANVNLKFGGRGGGGNGGNTTIAAQDGVANTGGGAGGIGEANGGASGGSGIVIVRYLTVGDTATPPLLELDAPIDYQIGRAHV